MKFVQTNDIRQWLEDADQLSQLTKSIGTKVADSEFLEQELGIPVHLRFLIESLAAEAEGTVEADALDSIPFYSLCRGLLIPLSLMEQDKAASIFGLQTDPPLDSQQREVLLTDFVEKEIGLTLVEKLGCILGDPFLGRKSTFRRDRLIRFLLSVQMASRSQLLDRLTQVGDVAVLFAESRSSIRGEPQLTAAEVIRLMRFLPDIKVTEKFKLLRSLWDRCGKVEAYFLAKLLLRKAGFGFDYQGPLLSRLLAARFNVPAEQISHAMALTDIFHVTQVLQDEGVAGLRSIQLQPLVPVRPALAGGHTDDLDEFPVWVERKYDGIRFMLHKSTDQRGSVLCGAYTRNRGDWLEQVPGLDASIQMLPVPNVIVDGELYGTVLDLDGSRPASVYEVYSSLQGEAGSPVNLRFAAFDLVYLNGADLTAQPLHERRKMLSSLISPLASMSPPIPITLAEGQMANAKEDVNRLYQHFRAQGYEGVITKDINGQYLLATRDPKWMKRKPLITLDLVLLGATFAVTTKQNVGTFGSYVIGIRDTDGSFIDVGDVAGIDKVRDAEIQQEIMRDGLMTGKRIERPSSSGTRPGIELRPSIVVTVKFEGVIRDHITKQLSLRDPKLAVIRSDKSANEADSLATLEELYLKQRVG